MTRRPQLPPGWVPPAGPGGGHVGEGGWVRLVSPGAARLGDEAAVASGESWTGLMRRAAGHLARGVLDVAGGGYGRRIVLLVGKGDNGGDGWAAAEVLRRAGAQPTVVAVHGTDTEASEATAHFRSRWLRGGGRVVAGTDGLDALLASADVVVDCLLGTGTTGAPRGVVADVLHTLAGHDVPIVACDVPTGVDAATGAVPGEVVTADLTVTFGACKVGLLLAPAREHTGRIVVASLGERYPVLDGVGAEGVGGLDGAWAALTAAGAAPRPADDDAEKRTRGVALAVVGARGTAGAAALCTRGLLSGGAGLVTSAVPSAIQHDLAPLVPAAMTQPLADDDGVVAEQAVDDLHLDGFDVVVAGPGLGHGPGARAVVEHLLANAPRLVLDADALNAFRDDPERLADHAGLLVVTPHARELARISGHEDAGDRRAEVAAELSARLDAVVVAKGPGTVVAAPDGRRWVTPTGSSALATGGTGDVLAGLVAAAVATADDAPLAVARAVWQHGFAGQVLGARSAGRLTADALAERFPSTLADLRDLADRRPAWPLDGGTSPITPDDLPSDPQDPR